VTSNLLRQLTRGLIEATLQLSAAASTGDALVVTLASLATSTVLLTAVTRTITGLLTRVSHRPLEIHSLELLARHDILVQTLKGQRFTELEKVQLIAGRRIIYNQVKKSSSRNKEQNGSEIVIGESLEFHMRETSRGSDCLHV
jgi:hypothetical protein